MRAALALVELAFLAVLTFALPACKREAACREVCTQFGIDAASEQCTMMCKTDCRELEQKFGYSIERCRAMQRGEAR